MEALFDYLTALLIFFAALVLLFVTALPPLSLILSVRALAVRTACGVPHFARVKNKIQRLE